MPSKVICIVLGNYFDQVIGGAEYQAYLLAKELIANGCLVHYIFIDNGTIFKSSLRELKLHPVKRVIYSRRIISNYANIIDGVLIYKELKEINPDVIYTRIGNAYTAFTLSYAKKHNKQHIWHVALDSDVQKIKVTLQRIVTGSALEKYMLEWGIKNADGIFVQTKYQDILLRKYYEKSADLVIPNFHPKPTSKINKDTENINIVWAANFKAAKRPLVFLSLAEAIKSNKKVLFHVAGRSDSKDSKVFFQRLKKLDNVKYYGELTMEEVNKLISNAHVFVNTSSIEGFPNTFIQAWLHKAVVLSLSIDPDDVLKEQGIGICSGTKEKLINDCKNLISDPVKMKSIAEKAYSYAIRHHSLDVNARKLLHFMEI